MAEIYQANIELVRASSDTPNILNTDDFMSIRYAYGNQDGYVKNKGTELAYQVNGSSFTIKSGRIVLQGVECDIDANGATITIDSVPTKRSYVVFLKVNFAGSLELATILSQYSAGEYPPTIDPGDDLTKVVNGSANLPLYEFQATDGVISNITKIVKAIEFTENVKVKNSTDSDYAMYASRATAKGTIEERLSSAETKLVELGFKSGVINVAGVDYGSVDYKNTVNPGIYKLGKFVVCNIVVERTLTAEETRTYIGNSNTNPLFIIPEGFRPKRPLYTIALIASLTVTRPYLITIDTDGVGKIYETFGETVKDELIGHLMMNFGFELA